MQANRGGHVALMTWPEIASRSAAGAIGLLPVGAASKEHGWHLPMATDWLQAEWLAARACERRDVLAWPTVGYGYYPAFVEYAGSISLSESTFAAATAEMLQGIAAAGVGRCLVLNTGVSTIGPLRAATTRANRRDGGRFHLHNTAEGKQYQLARRRLEQQRRGGHADEMETSVMLVLAPELVRMERAQPADDVEFPAGPLQPTPSPSGNHSPSGVYGNPTLANAPKGRALLAAMLADLDEALDRCAARGHDA